MSFNFVPDEVFEVNNESDVLLNIVEAGNSASSRSPTSLLVFGNSAVSMLLGNLWFGSGLDGDLILQNQTLTLTRDMYFNNLSIRSGGAIDCQNYRLFVCGTLDLSLASTGAIHANGPNGGSASGSTVASLPSTILGGTFVARSMGTAGESGSANSSHETVSLNVSGNIVMGGNSGFGGKGGGSYSYTKTNSNSTRNLVQPSLNPQADSSQPPTPGRGGYGGYRGLGDGSSSIGGAGGNGGAAGGYLWISSAKIKWGENANTSILQANGGNGGNGGNAQGTNASGGGGGGGGGGGVVHLVFGSDDRRDNPRTTAAGRVELIEASGGVGGSGGLKIGSGVDGENGQDGIGGSVLVYEIGTGEVFVDRTDDNSRVFRAIVPL